MEGTVNLVWVVQESGDDDDGDCIGVYKTKEAAITGAKMQLDDDLLENSEEATEPPDVSEEDNRVVVSYDDYMSYTVYPVPAY